MATQKQIASARRNGVKSKGPLSPEGKAKSSRNALKHGLAADPDIVLESENDDTYDRLLESYMDVYKPAGGDEYDLVCQVVSASWRLRRIGRMEAGIIERQMQSNIDFMTDPGSGPQLESLSFRNLANTGRSIDLVIRYTAMARRSYDTALKTLRHIQMERRKLEKQNEPESPQVRAKSTSSTSQPGAAFAAGLRPPRPLAVFPAPSAEILPIVSPSGGAGANDEAQNGLPNQGQC